MDRGLGVQHVPPVGSFSAVVVTVDFRQNLLEVGVVLVQKGSSDVVPSFSGPLSGARPCYRWLFLAFVAGLGIGLVLQHRLAVLILSGLSPRNFCVCPNGVVDSAPCAHCYRSVLLL